MSESPPIDIKVITKKPNVIPDGTNCSSIAVQNHTLRINTNMAKNNGIIYNIDTNNQFSALDKNSKSVEQKVNIADATKNNSKIKNKKIPPITVVGAINFSKAITIVSEIAKNNYVIKYMSIGVKFFISDLSSYNGVKSKLLNENIEFYSHDLNVEKYEQFILSGINKIPNDELSEELKTNGFEVININEIPISKPRFLNEGLYRVTFKGPVDQTKLARTRLNHTVVK